MGAHICPNCKQDSFFWFIDDEISELTIWACFKCQYEAFENESDVRQCIICRKNIESKLKDKEREYWWCSGCNSINRI